MPTHCCVCSALQEVCLRALMLGERYTYTTRTFSVPRLICQSPAGNASFLYTILRAAFHVPVTTVPLFITPSIEAAEFFGAGECEPAFVLRSARADRCFNICEPQTRSSSSFSFFFFHSELFCSTVSRGYYDFRSFSRGVVSLQPNIRACSRVSLCLF